MTPNLVPTILVRKHVILATVLHIRCLVKADQVIIFDTVGTKDSKLQSGFIAHLTVS
jgi:magnesium transporter